MSTGGITAAAAGSRTEIGWSLLMLETGSNQDYIFATNRMRENVGASHLTVLPTTVWLDEALARREAPSQVIQQISGSALVLFGPGRADAAERVAAEVCVRALAEAPGLDLASELVDCPDPEVSTADELSEAIRRASARVQQNRAGRPGPQARHPRLPLTADCGSSGAGASAEQLLPSGWQPRSAASITKRAAGEAGLARISKEIARSGADLRLARSLDQLEHLLEDGDELPWLAVVHADGNGVGEILLGLASGQDGRAYADGLMRFSRTLEQCGARAFAAACGSVKPTEGIVPVVPLVLGGDDLTALVPGRDALPFTVAYLRAFEEETARELAELAPGGRLSACAGVAITKPHHPFSEAYRLAEHLADSAKRVKRIVCDAQGRRLPCSAVNFHLVYASLVGEVADMEDDLRIPGERGDALLTARPYVVSDLKDEQRWADAQPRAREWLFAHDYRVLEHRHEALAARDPEDPARAAISRSQVLALRSGLRDSVEVADARAALAQSRHPKLKAILERRAERPSLFEARPGADIETDGAPILHCRLLDALTLVELAGGQATEELPA